MEQFDLRLIAPRVQYYAVDCSFATLLRADWTMMIMWYSDNLINRPSFHRSTYNSRVAVETENKYNISFYLRRQTLNRKPYLQVSIRIRTTFLAKTRFFAHTLRIYIIIKYSYTCEHLYVLFNSFVWSLRLRPSVCRIIIIPKRKNQSLYYARRRFVRFMSHLRGAYIRIKIKEKINNWRFVFPVRVEYAYVYNVHLRSSPPLPPPSLNEK